MYQLYKRVPKNLENLYGSKLIEEGENPFMKGPCFLCIAASETLDKSVFGMSKQGMKMAGADKFDLSTFPVTFLSMKLNIKDEEATITSQERIEKLVHTYLVPLVSNNNQRIDCTQAMRQMRNVNILSYCDGTVTVQNIEKCLIDKMHELGYTNEEIGKIQSQMMMFPIATNRLEGKQKSTCISFKDINDDEVSDDITPEVAQSVYDSPIGETLVSYSNNELAYYMSSNGAHTIKAYTQMGRALPACLSSAVSKALQNSIHNANKQNEFIPLTPELVTQDFSAIMSEAERGMSSEGLLKTLKENLTYQGARKLSEGEIALSETLHQVCKELIKSKSELKRMQSAEHSKVGATSYQQGRIGKPAESSPFFSRPAADLLQESVEESKRLDQEIAILTAQQEK